MVTVHYQLIDTFENYKEFDTILEAVDWAEGIGEEMFVYLCIARDFQYIDSYEQLIQYGDMIRPIVERIKTFHNLCDDGDVLRGKIHGK